MEPNGDGNGRIYVRFGPLDNHEMDRDWGVSMADSYLRESAASFGRALAKGQIDMRDIPGQWLEAILTNWRESAPSAFGGALAKVVTEGAGRGK